MRSNIDLTENRNFAKKISERVFSAEQILYEDIRDEDDFNAYYLSHCYCCGRAIKEYTWSVSKCFGICKKCDGRLSTSMGRESIRSRLFLKNKIISSKFKTDNKNDRSPWFINNSKESIIDNIKQLVQINERELWS